MKKQIFQLSIVAFLSTLNLQSCREDIVTSNIEPTGQITRKNEQGNIYGRQSLSAETLASDETFVKMYEIQVSHLNNVVTDKVLARNLMAKGDDMTKEEEMQFVVALGFSSVVDFINYNNILVEYANILEKNYSLQSIDNSIKNPIIEEAFAILDQANNNYLSLSKKDPKKFARCRRGAFGQYAITMTGCVGGGIAIGAMSFGFAAPLGGVLAGACAAGAQLVLEDDLGECHDLYNT